MPRQILLSWSGGKDSMLALHKLTVSQEYKVEALISHVDESTQRVSVHGIPRHLIEQQAKALGLPLSIVELPSSPSNAAYETCVATALEPYRKNGIDTVAYGDLFLEDIRQYREQMLANLGMRGHYPIWGNDTLQLAHEFINSGFKALLVCVDSSQLDAGFVGRWFDDVFLKELPSNVDPCGENGEFHTFVVDGPLLKSPVPLEIGETFVRDNRFYHCEMQ